LKVERRGDEENTCADLDSLKKDKDNAETQRTQSWRREEKTNEETL